MTPGSLTLACMLLAVNAAEPPDTVYMNTPKFAIPITIQPQRRAEISELELHMSRDRGQTWELNSRATPDKDAFQVETHGDGPYWFSVVIVDAQRRREPLDVKSAPVGQKVFVDTTRPEIKLTAERQGDEIVVTWDVHEDNLDPRTLRVEWMQGGALPVVAPIINEPRGQVHIKPSDPYAAVSVRMTAVDQAQNQGMGSAEVPAMSAAPPGYVVSKNITTPPVTQVRGPDSMPPPPSPAGNPPAPVFAPAPQPAPLASTPGGTQIGYSPTPPQDYATTNAVNSQMSDVKIVNKREVKLDFEVAKYGPTGLGSVDVYTTLDDGRTWKKSFLEPNATTLPATAIGSGPMRGAVAVKMDQEGVVYGFYLVVKSRAGLGKPAPRSGDAPLLRVEVDQTAPSAKLLEPQADPTQPNTLILNWTATDKHLTANPITVEWRAEKVGDWHLIGESAMPNTGQFKWSISADVPPSVYLRLTVRDTAGNVAVAETDKPVLVDLSVPEVSGIGLQVGAR